MQQSKLKPGIIIIHIHDLFIFYIITRQQFQIVKDFFVLFAHQKKSVMVFKPYYSYTWDGSYFKRRTKMNIMLCDILVRLWIM